MDDHFAFHLSPDEHRRMRKIVRRATGGMHPWYYALVAAIYALEVAISFFLHRAELEWINLLSAAFWGFSWFRSTKNSQLAVEGDLRLASSGFVGTLDKEPAQLNWSDIANVSDIDNSIVIFRRKNLAPVALPKSSIADIAGLWAILEDRLVSKRGLIRSAAPRSQILNSAY